MPLMPMLRVIYCQELQFAEQFQSTGKYETAMFWSSSCDWLHSMLVMCKAVVSCRCGHFSMKADEDDNPKSCPKTQK